MGVFYVSRYPKQNYLRHPGDGISTGAFKKGVKGSGSGPINTPVLSTCHASTVLVMDVTAEVSSVSRVEGTHIQHGW